METLEVGLFSKMKICSVVAAAVVLVCLGVGVLIRSPDRKIHWGRSS